MSTETVGSGVTPCPPGAGCATTSVGIPALSSASTLTAPILAWMECKA